MIKRTLHFLWGKKFAFLIFALLLILLPNTIGRGFQIRTTTVVTEMEIQRHADKIKVTAKCFKPSNDSEKENYQTLTFQGTNIREMLADVSLAHCDKITFSDEQPDMEILHELYHYRDLRGNTKVNEDKSIGELLKSQRYHYQ